MAISLMAIPTVTEASQWDSEKRLSVEKRIRREVARRAAAEKDILTWGQMLFPATFSLPYCYPLHNYFIQIRREELTNTKAPRYHSKTTIKCFLIPLFQALYEPDTFNHYLNVQATDTKAHAVNLSMRTELEENEDLRALVGDQTGSRWGEKQFVLKNGVCFSAVGAGQSIRGINYRTRRPDYILVDDLYDEEEIYNPEAVEKKNAWFWSTLYPARAQGRKCSIHVQGTAISEKDLMSKLEKSKRWMSKTFQSIPGYPAQVVPLWPEKNTYESLMADKADMTTTIWMREMQNEPRDDASSLIKLAWIKEYDPAFLVPRGTFDYVRTVLGCDPSIGEKLENDYTAIVVMHVFRYTDGKGYWYYIDQVWNGHWTLKERCDLLQRIQDELPADRKISIAYLEGIAGFKDFVAEARRTTSLPIREVDKVKDKLANVESKAWFFETGRVFINQEIRPDLKDQWKYQMTTNHPDYDDVRDATLLPLEMGRIEAWAYMD
jgi:hypothetical protein